MVNFIIYAIANSIVAIIVFKLYAWAVKANSYEEQRKKEEKRKMEFYRKINVSHFKDNSLYKVSSN